MDSDETIELTQRLRLHPNSAGYLRIAGRFAGSPEVSRWITQARADAASKPVTSSRERVQ